MDGVNNKIRVVVKSSSMKLPLPMCDSNIGDVLNCKWDSIAAANFCDRAADNQHVIDDATILQSD